MAKPNFYKQIDSRWASNRYKCTGGTMSIGGGGCGPTSIANIVSALIDPKITPIDVMKYICKHGYMIANQGTTWQGITNTLKHYGVDKFKVTYSSTEAKKSLKKNHWVLGVVGPSRWTRGGHYIVAYAITESGRIRVSDPASYADYRQKEGFFSEFSKAARCMWIEINPADYKEKKKKKKVKAKSVTLYVDDAKANVRKGRGTKYGVVGKIERGKKLLLTSYKSGWYKIASGKFKGKFISSKSLTKYKPSVATYKANYKMNVRKGYTTKAEIKGTIKKGTKIKSAYKVGNWIYVPALKGWICVKDSSTTYLKKV